MDDHHASTQSLELGISTAFYEKDNTSGRPKEWAHGYSFKPSRVTLRELADHVLAGGAWVPAKFRGNTRRANPPDSTFIHSQVIALDFDNNVSVEALLRVPFVRQYAAFIHPTPSSGKITEKNPTGGYRTRAVFKLDTPVTVPAAWSELSKAVARETGLDPDKASFNAAQPYFGSTNTVEAYYLNEAAVLPLTVAGALTYAQAKEDDERRSELANHPRHPITGARAERYAQVTFENKLAELAAAPHGARNHTLYAVAISLFSKVAGDWPGIDAPSVQRELERIVCGWDNVSKSLRTIKRAQRAATPEPLELPDLPAQKRATYERQAAPAPAPDLEISAQYLSYITHH